MRAKTLLAIKQVISHTNLPRGAAIPRRVARKVEQLVEEGVLEFVPWSNFNRFTFRDTLEGAYLIYEHINLYRDGFLETLTAAVPKVREKDFDIASYASRFRKKYFAELPKS